MATTIDQRIVEMKFDNRDFERNTRTTMSTLEKLKEKLNFTGASKGLDQISKSAKNVDMRGLATGVETVQAKFSALEIIGTTALVNITNSAVNAGKQLVKSLTIDQVTSGWSKMAEKMGSVQTLVNSTGLDVDTIEDYLSELMWYSDETSYSFTDMTKALANMTATGGKIEKLIPMIRGMANATAFAGKGAAEFSRIIYNLNQSYGAGYLTLMDWKSVQLAGANSKQLVEEFIRVGEALGTIEKGTVTIGNFNETLKHKWVTTEVMEKAFGRFDKLSALAYDAVKNGLKLPDGTIKEFNLASEAIEYLSEHAEELGIEFDELAFKGFRAAQEAKTLREAIEATADTSSSAWETIFEDIFGNYDSQKRIFTDFANWLYNVFVEPIYAIEEVVRNAFDFSGFNKMWTKLTNNSLFKAVDTMSEKIKTATKTLEEYQEIVAKVWNGDYNNHGDNPDRFDLLTQAGWDWRVVQELVNQTDRMAGYGKGWSVVNQLNIDDVVRAEQMYGVSAANNVKTTEEQIKANKELLKSLENISEEKLRQMGLTDEEIRMYQSLQRASKKYGISMSEIIEKMKNMSGRDLLFGKEATENAKAQAGILQNIASALGNIAGAAKNAAAEVFTPFGGAELYMILDRLHKFSERIKEATENERIMADLQNTFKGLLSILKLVLIVSSGVYRILWTVFKTALSVLGISVLDFTGALGELISKFVDFITKNDILIKGIEILTRTLTKSFKRAYDWIHNKFDISDYLYRFEGMLERFRLKLYDFWEGAKLAKKEGRLGQYLIDSFVAGWEQLKEWLKDKKDRFFDWIVRNFGDTKGKLGAWIDQIPIKKEAGKLGQHLIDGLVQGLTYGLTKVKDGILWVANIIIQTFEKIFDINSPSKVMEKEGNYLIEGLVNGIKGFAGYLYDLFSAIGEKIIEIIKSFDLGSVFVALISAGTIFAFVKMAKAITILADGLESINGVIATFQNTLATFNKVLKTIKAKIITSAIKDIAISIAILAASVWLLAKIESPKLWGAIGAMAVLVVMLGALVAVATLLGGKGGKKVELNLAKLALTIIAIGIAMALMASALKKVAKIETTAWGAIAAFGVMIAAFIVIMKMLLSNDKDFVKMGGTLLAISAIFYIMARSVKVLGKMEKADLIQGMIAIGLFLGMIALLMLSTKLINGSKNVEKIGASLLAIGATFYLMARVVKILGKMKIEELAQGMAALAAFTIMIMTLMWATKYLVGSKNVEKIGASLLAIGGAFALMALSVRILGKMDLGSLIKGTLVVGAFMAMTAMLMQAMKKIGVNEVANLGKTMLGIAVAIGVMAASVALLSIIKLGNLIKGIAAVGALTLFMTMLIKATKNSHEVNKTVLAIATTIGIFALALGILSLIKPEKLIGPTIALGILMGMFSVMLTSAKHVKSSALKALWTIVAAVGIMAAIVVGLSFINADKALKASASIAILLLSMTASLFVLEKMGGISLKNVGTGLLGLLGLLVIITGIVGILSLMQNIKNADKNAIILASFLGVLTLILIATTVVGLLYAATGGLAATGLLGLAAILVVLLGVIGILALMNKINNAETNAKTLTNFMTSMTEILLKVAIMGPLALIGVAALTGLVALMGILLIFITSVGAIVTYIPALKTFITNGLDLLITLAGGLGEMIGAFVNGALTQISSGLPEIGTNLSKFMLNVTPFVVGAKAVDSKTLSGVKILAGSIILMTAADLINSIGTFLSGGNGLAELGTELSKFMVNALPFIQIASTLNGDMMNGIKGLSKAILTLTAADLLQGIKNFITGGSSSLSDFGEQLPGLGTYLSQFSSNLGEFSEEQVTTVDCAGRAIEALANAASKIPNEGGWVSKILGENSLAKFGEDLPNIALSIKGFVTNLGQFNEEQIKTAECASKVIVALADAAKKLPNEGGLWAKIFGDNSLSKFAKDMPGVAEGVKGFVDKLGNFGDKTESVNAAANVIQGVADFADADLKEASKNLPDFGTKLVGFGTKLASFINKIAGLGDEKLTLVSNNLKIILDAVKSLLDTIRKTAEDKTTELEASFEGIALKAAKALGTQSVKNELKTQGVNFVTGFANSITNNSNLATNAASTMATNALNAIKKVQNSHSPSKETMKLGGYFGEGFVIGIEEYSTKVYDVSSNIGDDAKRGLTKAVSDISSLVESGIDAQPTIRPILDLDDVTNGINEMNGLFTSPSMSVLSNLNSISSSMNARRQNGNNDDVISAINKLGKNINEYSGNTYNINGITYDDQSSVSDAVQTLLRAINIERRM